MMSRNRPTGPGTRVYMRATTNPGGVGHGWVKARFITPARPAPPSWSSSRCGCRTEPRRCWSGQWCLSRPACSTTPPCWKMTRTTLPVWQACPKRKSRPCSMAAGTAFGAGVHRVEERPGALSGPALDPCHCALCHPQTLEDLPGVRFRFLEAVLSGVVRGG